MRTNRPGWALEVVLTPIVLAAMMASPRVAAFQAAPGYDHQTEVVVTGFVRTVTQVGTDQNVHLHVILDTPAGTIDVDVAPQWFLTQQRFAIMKGDQIEVVGSRMLKDNEDETLVARRIRNGKHMITLRDKRGFPAWVDR